MTKTKVVILGSNGYLGSYIAQELQKDDNLVVYPLNRQSDMNEYLIRLTNVDYLINCAGLVDIKKCQENPEKSLESNLSYFVRTCDYIRPRQIINISSYFVYDKNWSPFRTNYALHKYLADEYTLKKGGSVFVLGKLFGKSPKSQDKFPEQCFSDEQIRCENVIHPFTHLSTVFSWVKEEIYNIKTKSDRIKMLDFSCYPGKFAEICGHKNIIGVPPSSPFERYGEFLQSENKLSRLNINVNHYKRAMTNA